MIPGDIRQFDGPIVQCKILNEGILHVASMDRMMSDQLAMIKGNGMVHDQVIIPFGFNTHLS
jgi:hypothetical protein